MSFVSLRAQKSDVKNAEWGRNLQILSLQMPIGFSPVLCVFAVILLLIGPLGVHSCVRVVILLPYHLVMLTKQLLEKLWGSCGSLPCLCYRDPRNSGCLPPDPASDPTLRANQFLSYYKPRGKICSALGTTRNCFSECMSFTVNLHWVGVSVSRVHEGIEWNGKVLFSSFLKIPSLVLSYQPTERLLVLSWYTLIWTCTWQTLTLVSVVQVIFIFFTLYWHCTYYWPMRGCCVGF